MSLVKNPRGKDWATFGMGKASAHRRMLHGWQSLLAVGQSLPAC